MLPFSPHRRGCLTLLGAALVAHAAHAAIKITLTPDLRSLDPGQPCVARAEDEARPDHRKWDWKVAPEDACDYRQNEQGELELHAPLDLTEPLDLTISVQAQGDTSAPASRELTLSAGPLFDQVLPAILGEGWNGPRQEPLTGELLKLIRQDRRGVASRPMAPRSLVHLQDPEHAELDGRWAFVENGGVYLATREGEVTQWLGSGTGAVQLAPRPCLDAKDSSFPLVFSGADHTIRQVDGAGRITLLAGTPGQTGYGDGKAAEAFFRNPSGLAQDDDGNVFVADRGNRAIRRIGTDGLVHTLAGGDDMPDGGDGDPLEAGFKEPSQMVRDPATGMLYVLDRNRIRKVTPMGLVTTVAGRDTVYPTPDKDLHVRREKALAARNGAAAPVTPGLDRPRGLALFDGHLTFADHGGKVLKEVDLKAGEQRVLGGDLAARGSQAGPLRPAVPGQPVDPDAAALDIQAMAYDPAGVAGVSMGPGLGELCLPRGKQPATPADPKVERKTGLPPKS
jgi:hypothetical protein